MPFEMHCQLDPQHRTIFATACDLFSQGEFYGAIRATRKMFAVNVTGTEVSTDVVWCDHLPTQRAIYPGIVEFSIRDNQMLCMVQCEQLRARSLSPHGLCHAINLVLHSVTSGKHPDRRLLFDIGDGQPGKTPRKVAYCSADPVDALVMDPEFALSHGYEVTRREAAELPPWQSRRDKVVWRGATTGQVLQPVQAGNCAADDWMWLQRLHLCSVASRSRHCEFLDVGVSHIVQLDAERTQRVTASGFLRSGIKQREFGLARYAIDIDGNSNAWSGLFTKLLMGCCVLKVASPHGFRQWYYDALRPWEHYVPVAAHFADFDQVLERLRDDPGTAEKVAAQGQELASALTFDVALNQAMQVLDEC